MPDDYTTTKEYRAWRVRRVFMPIVVRVRQLDGSVTVSRAIVHNRRTKPSRAMRRKGLHVQ